MIDTMPSASTFEINLPTIVASLFQIGIAYLLALALLNFPTLRYVKQFK